MNTRIAFASTDDFEVNQHFGGARIFQVYETDGSDHQRVETRKTGTLCQGSYEGGFDHLFQALLDCDAIFALEIDQGVSAYMISHGKRVFGAYGSVDAIMEKVVKENLFQKGWNIPAKTFREPTLTRPCFSVGDKVNKGRVHLPVSPGCNICYRFCDRKINDMDIRPGVASMIITPQGAVEVVRRAVELCPDITVAGIVGPGDTLMTSYALETFRFIKQEFPDIIKCMSTNGLPLPECTQKIVDVGIDTPTITVNALDPEIQAQICSRIVYHGKRYKGVEAAGILIENQLKGVGIVSEAGITVKVNTVLIPEINADHTKAVAQAVIEVGARIYDIIPLIPQHELS